MSATTLTPSTSPEPVLAESIPPARRRRASTVAKVLFAVVLAVAVTGCARRAPVPTSYGKEGSSVEKNFLGGCDGTKGHQAGDPVSPESVCKCEWHEIMKAYPNFSDFKKIYDDMTDHPGPLPAKMQAIVADCNKPTT